MANIDQKIAGWDAYWHQNSKKPGCLPNSPEAFNAVLTSIWQNFAKTLEQGSKVVDMACGEGAVGNIMLATNRELDLCGIDYANIAEHVASPFPILQESIESTSINSGTIHSIVSQFGIEYSNISKFSTELSRITAPNAKIHAVLHHSDSAILATNQKRGDFLKAVDNQTLWQAAKDRNITQLQDSFDILLAEYGESELFLEMAHAVRAILPKEEAERNIAIDSLSNAIQHEIRILDSLQAAAISPKNIENWIKPLSNIFKLHVPETIKVGDDIIGWLLSGEKK